MGDYLLLTLQQLIGSSTHLVAKRVVSQLSPELSLFWRSLIAALSSMAWLLYENHRTALLHRLRLRQVVLLLVLGLLAVPLNQWCFLAGVRLSTPANASLMYALTPVWTLLLSSALHQERLTALKLTGVLLAVGGVWCWCSGRKHRCPAAPPRWGIGSCCWQAGHGHSTPFSASVLPCSWAL
ncbi:MAG: DMT family transporter [Chlorobiota bacterium]|nr:DMT family transporter [Chlorobiota bacterium]